MSRNKKNSSLTKAPHRDHAPPVSRRDFISQGLASGFALTMAPSLLLSILKSETAQAAACTPTGLLSNGLIPMVVLDMAGGLGLPSNVIVGKTGGSADYLTS